MHATQSNSTFVWGERKIFDWHGSSRTSETTVPTHPPTIKVVVTLFYRKPNELDTLVLLLLFFFPFPFCLKYSMCSFNIINFRMGERNLQFAINKSSLKQNQMLASQVGGMIYCLEVSKRNICRRLTRIKKIEMAWIIRWQYVRECVWIGLLGCLCNCFEWKIGSKGNIVVLGFNVEIYLTSASNK